MNGKEGDIVKTKLFLFCLAIGLKDNVYKKESLKREFLDPLQSIYYLARE